MWVLMVLDVDIYLFQTKLGRGNGRERLHPIIFFSKDDFLALKINIRGEGFSSAPNHLIKNYTVMATR